MLDFLKKRDLKRLSDIVMSTTGLVVLSPVMVLTTAVMWADTGSFPLFRQTRVGLHGKPFSINKNTTMSNETDPEGNPLPDAVRTSWLAEIIRKLRFDELPQLFNVAKGEMSIVGPRPKQPGEYEAQFPERFKVKPGLTGHAQIRGANSLTPEEIVACDLEDIRIRRGLGQVSNLMRDFSIIARTPMALLSNWNAPHASRYAEAIARHERQKAQAENAAPESPREPAAAPQAAAQTEVLPVRPVPVRASNQLTV